MIKIHEQNQQHTSPHEQQKSGAPAFFVGRTKKDSGWSREKVDRAVEQWFVQDSREITQLFWPRYYLP